MATHILPTSDMHSDLIRYPTLRTGRLILVPLQLNDAEAIQLLFPHREVVRYLASAVPWPYPSDGALQFVRDHELPAIGRGTQWSWTIRLRMSPEQLIGSISLYDEPDNNRGFWLAPKWHGHGYMGEACEPVNRYWFETLNRPVMRVPKAVANQPSRRISEREGMQLVDTRDGHFVCGKCNKKSGSSIGNGGLNYKAGVSTDTDNRPRVIGSPPNSTT